MTTNRHSDLDGFAERSQPNRRPARTISATTDATSAFPAPRKWGRRGILGLGFTAAVAGSLLTATGTASASTVNDYSASLQDYSSYSTLVAASSWLDVAVSGGSTAAGAPIIQWWADGGAEQQWRLPLAYRTGEIINENSGMCITTDGVAGDQLFQEPCAGSTFGSGPTSGYQQWQADYTEYGPTTFVNPASGLVLDVSGYSLWGGGAIDAWYPNGQLNQTFWSATEGWG
jgi:hypothetical protein